MNKPVDRKRVVICTDGVFPQAMGGMQRHTRLLVEYLATTGQWDITVVHPHEIPVFDPACGVKEVRVDPIDTERFYLGELWRYSERVAEVLERTEAHVILSQGFCVWKSIRRFGARLILHPHGLEMFQGISLREKLQGLPFRMVLRYMARRSTFVVSLGGGLTRILERLVAGSNARVASIPNAVELPLVRAGKPAREGPLRFLFVGRFAFNKGLDVLLAVARRLEREGKGGLFRFDLAGDGPLMDKIRREGLPSNVTLLGRVDDPTLFKAYEDCDAFLLPTRFEGMPTVVLEAMARSCPVLVSDVGATAELVDARNGFLLPKGDEKALYQAILDLGAASKEQRMAMGEASRERVEKEFTWQSVTKRFSALFSAVAEGRDYRE